MQLSQEQRGHGAPADEGRLRADGGFGRPADTKERQPPNQTPASSDEQPDGGRRGERRSAT